VTEATDPIDPVATARMAARVARIVRPDASGLTLRVVRDADAVALVRLIGAAYDEFDCGPLDPGGFDADLAAPATFGRSRGRRWWVVTGEDDVPLASVAHSEPREDTATSAGRSTVVELHRLYLAPAVRGQGLASALVAGVADEAQRLGGQRLIAWSDTRLVAAHARYLALGFTTDGASRELHDPAGTTELRFDLRLLPAPPPDRTGPRRHR
jgi:putative acetyltransferase